MSKTLDALQVNLEQMKHWEMAPANPSKTEAAAGIEIALTAEGLEEKKDFGVICIKLSYMVCRKK